MFRLLPFLAILLLVAACASAPKPPPDDPFFRLPLSPDPTPAGANSGAAGGSTESGVPKAYTIAFRFFSGDDATPLSAPVLTTLAGQRASITLMNQMSFVQDFDVEVVDEKWLADPIVGIIQDGLVVDVVARPVEGSDRIAFTWGLMSSELAKPIRVKHVPLSAVTAPVSIQLPSIPIVSAVGRTLLVPGEDTLLAEAPTADGKGMLVTVRVEPARLGEIPNPSAAEFFAPTLVLGASEPSTIFTEAANLPAPTSSGLLELMVVRLKAPLPRDALHLDPMTAELALERMKPETLRTIRLRTGADPLAKASLLLQKSYLKDYETPASGHGTLLDPIIDNLVVGLTAEVRVQNGEPTLVWEFSTLLNLEDYTTRVGDAVATVELPEILIRSGALPLRSAVNLADIGPLADGTRLALLVRR